ncbi:MFS transporter [Bacillus wiedmannii]
MKFTELHPNIRIRICIDFVQRIFNNMIIPFMAIYLTTHFGLKIAGILMMLAILTGILTSFYGSYYSDIKGRKRVLLIAEAINSIIFISMAIFNSDWILSPMITYILYIIHNVVAYSATPAAEAMLIDVSTPEVRKYVYSISYWVVNLAFGIGSIMGAFFIIIIFLRCSLYQV